MTDTTSPARVLQCDRCGTGVDSVLCTNGEQLCNTCYHLGKTSAPEAEAYFPTTPTSYAETANAIRHLRAWTGLGIGALAARLGISTIQLGQFEQGLADELTIDQVRWSLQQILGKRSIQA